MKQELELKLVSKYPKIFAEHGGKISETPMAFGIQHGDGWYDILDSLCYEIQNEVDWVIRDRPDTKFRCVAEQVKEKYGTLRFYVRYEYDPDILPRELDRLAKSMDKISGMIAMAERMSSRVCESCGGNSYPDFSAPFPRNECDACEALRYDATDERDQT